MLQTTDYYTFGLTMANGNKVNADQPYQYGGKEWQNNTQVYDFHARQYNPALGRWFNLDPLMEKYAGVSSYNYCLNNPVNIVDPTGLLPERPWDWNENVDGEWGSVSSLRRAGYDYLSAYRMAVVDSYLDGGGSDGKGYYERHDILPVFSSTEAVLGRLLSLGFTIEESIVVHYEGMAATLFAKLLNNTSAKAVRYGEGGLSITTKNVYNTQIDPRDPFRTYKSDGDLAIAAALGVNIVTVKDTTEESLGEVIIDGAANGLSHPATSYALYLSDDFLRLIGLAKAIPGINTTANIAGAYVMINDINDPNLSAGRKTYKVVSNGVPLALSTGSLVAAAAGSASMATGLGEAALVLGGVFWLGEKFYDGYKVGVQKICEFESWFKNGGFNYMY